MKVCSNVTTMIQAAWVRKKKECSGFEMTVNNIFEANILFFSRDVCL